jgi:hypothetical protein
MDDGGVLIDVKRRSTDRTSTGRKLDRAKNNVYGRNLIDYFCRLPN